MRERVTYIDTLRVLATVMVIFIHVSSVFVSSCGLCPGMEGFLPYRFVYCLSLCAVAIFVMISGMLLLGKSQLITYNQVFRQYIPRILWALIIFALPMCMVEQIMTHNDAPVSNMLITSIVNFLTGNSWTHMWYLYMLLGLYFVVPLLHNFVQHTSKKEHTQLAVVLTMIAIIIPNIILVTGADMHNYLRLPSFIGTFYFGFYLCKYCSKNNVVITSSLLCIMAYTAYCLLAAKEARPIVGPEFILSIATAGALFCIVRRWPVFSSICSRLAPHCFCIYIVHPVFLNLMFKVLHLGDKLTFSPWVNMIFIVGVAFLLSLSVSYVLHMIPFLRKKVL